MVRPNSARRCDLSHERAVTAATDAESGLAQTVSDEQKRSLGSLDAGAAAGSSDDGRHPRVRHSSKPSPGASHSLGYRDGIGPHWPSGLHAHESLAVVFRCVCLREPALVSSAHIPSRDHRRDHQHPDRQQPETHSYNRSSVHIHLQLVGRSSSELKIGIRRKQT